MQTKYLFMVSMDVDTENEAFFNEVYDTEHLPYLGAVPGVISATRMKMQPLTTRLDGAPQTIVMEDEPTYMAIYELESPDVLLSDAWAEAGAKGRWATEVRPLTKNRRHVLRKVMESSGG